MSYDLVIQNGTVVSPDMGSFEADVGVSGDVIASIAESGSLTGAETVDASGKYVLPGAIDPHTHHGITREFTADAESESRSDLVGGVTTIGNFFRRGEPYREVMDTYFEKAERTYYHDYFFSLGLLSRTHLEEIPYIVGDLGITSFKWYMNYKFAAGDRFGVDEDLTDDYANDMIQALADQPEPTTLGYHSENVEITRTETERAKAAGGEDYDTLLDAFPGYAETTSMVGGASLAYEHDYDDSFYVVHISAGGTVDALAALQDAGYDVTGETCPHYLTLTAEESEPMMRINPPIRTEQDRNRLWQGIREGTIDCIGTDHCCKPPEEKEGDGVWDVSNAFPGTPLMLPLILSEGVNEGRITLMRAVEITSTNAAKAWNLYPKKGAIRVGGDADLVVVDLEETRTVTPEYLQGGVDYSVYEGREVTGWPTHTIVRGTVAYENGTITGVPGMGTHIDRPV